MKFGIRKPSVKKRIGARTSIKRQIVHRGGFKMPRGYGWIRDLKNMPIIKFIIELPLIYLNC